MMKLAILLLLPLMTLGCSKTPLAVNEVNPAQESPSTSPYSSAIFARNK